MKKYLLFSLVIIISLIVSCAKSKNKTIVASNRFVPVRITPDVGACGCCGYGYFVSRQDSMLIRYHCHSLSANLGITRFPAFVNIQFHDTTGPCNTIHHIVIDSIKP